MEDGDLGLVKAVEGSRMLASGQKGTPLYLAPEVMLELCQRAAELTGGLQALSERIRFGYDSNEVGFGWTSGVFTRLYDGLPFGRRGEVLEA